IGLPSSQPSIDAVSIVYPHKNYRKPSLFLTIEIQIDDKNVSSCFDGIL
ncbi:9393_t:CDS:1, partial [Ambispora leptoticha]